MRRAIEFPSHNKIRRYKCASGPVAASFRETLPRFRRIAENAPILVIQRETFFRAIAEILLVAQIVEVGNGGRGRGIPLGAEYPKVLTVEKYR